MRRRDDENFLNRHCIMCSSNNNDDDDYVILHGVHSSRIEMHFGKFSRECMLKIKSAMDGKKKKKKEVWKLTLETQRRASEIKKIPFFWYLL